MNERILANSPSYLPPSPMLFHAMAQGGKEMGRRPSATCLSCQGTTGSPKGATLSHHNIVNNSNMIGERLRLHMKVRGCWPGQGLPALCRGGGLAGLPLLARATGFQGFWLPDRTSFLPPSPDTRVITGGPAQPPVPLPGFCGGHHCEHDVRRHPHPVLSHL